MNSRAHVAIRWCRDPGTARKLAGFFAANVTPEYISHSELQGPRALDVGLWRPGIEDIFATEIERRIAAGEPAPGSNSYPVAEAREDDQLVALALVSLVVDAPVPFAVLEDIAVAAASRNRGVGKGVLDWITREARQAGCARIFLESGFGNHHAHAFFEREGFAPCSVVMMKRLAPPP